MNNIIGFKPQKGKSFDDLPISEAKDFDTNTYLVSTKYDGNQIFIVKSGSTVRCFTSDWKEFTSIDDGTLATNDKDFILVAEFMYDSVGKLGDRRKSAILTTWRTNFNKGIKSVIPFSKLNIKVFDYLSIKDNKIDTNVSYLGRLLCLDFVKMPKYMSAIDYIICKGSVAKSIARQRVKEGWEGCMAVSGDEAYKIGKRVNYSVKLKFRKTADLLCIDTEPGLGKYENMIGSLILQDSKGRIVSVGSGLDDTHRSLTSAEFIGKVIEIEYEQLMNTYIQPTFLCVREDKTIDDID